MNKNFIIIFLILTLILISSAYSHDFMHIYDEKKNTMSFVISKTKCNCYIHHHKSKLDDYKFDNKNNLYDIAKIDINNGEKLYIVCHFLTDE